MTDITPLAMQNQDGQLVYTTYLIALVLGVHPDDITTTTATNVPERLQQQAYQRLQEAQAHGADTGSIPTATYWAHKEHGLDVHTDPLGQAWISTPPEQIWP